MSNFVINPETNRPVKIGSKTYNYLQKKGYFYDQKKSDAKLHQKKSDTKLYQQDDENNSENDDYTSINIHDDSDENDDNYDDTDDEKKSECSFDWSSDDKSDESSDDYTEQGYDDKPEKIKLVTKSNKKNNHDETDEEIELLMHELNLDMNDLRKICKMLDEK